MSGVRIAEVLIGKLDKISKETLGRIVERTFQKSWRHFWTYESLTTLEFEL